MGRGVGTAATTRPGVAVAAENRNGQRHKQGEKRTVACCLARASLTDASRRLTAIAVSQAWGRAQEPSKAKEGTSRRCCRTRSHVQKHRTAAAVATQNEQAKGIKSFILDKTGTCWEQQSRISRLGPLASGGGSREGEGGGPQGTEAGSPSRSGLSERRFKLPPHAGIHLPAGATRPVGCAATFAKQQAPQPTERLVCWNLLLLLLLRVLSLAVGPRGRRWRLV